MGYHLDLFVSKEIAEKYICVVCQEVAKNVCETELCKKKNKILLKIMKTTKRIELIRITTIMNESKTDVAISFVMRVGIVIIFLNKYKKKYICIVSKKSNSNNNKKKNKFLDREIENERVRCTVCEEWTGMLSQLSTHQSAECPNTLVKCVEWQRYGCDATIKRKDVSAHNKEYEATHLKLQIAHLQKSHKEEIAVLTHKYEREKQSLLDEYEHDKQVTETQWKRKFIFILSTLNKVVKKTCTL
ncbi:hypothetical protein RFI_03913 [Reticulomyxa filosa]|uniref:TRAF-type domain-containing protein n=1 Tax=Reticulomyxa filosa TaxID=46433 RepID=X6P3S2_RETFI|nr:hypothetical protein RFI_03913 [Reticulomyxa filosa]|eukprot:ETO33195.1 hypothetical protein RFI_03913 [Reticulomyxa filosa]